MADPRALEVIRKGVDEWNKWRMDIDSPDLSGADLRGANLRGADLRGADLGKADLYKADLGKANLHRAFLSVADLSWADLRGADLRGANLGKADLGGADLRGADLGGANLYRANLFGTNLSAAELTGADVNEAQWHEAILVDTSLKGVRGLDTCIHRGPSTIDHRTLARSGPLPLAFLRGCGLPDKLIDYLPSLLNEPISFYSCFISYSHADKSFARRLHDTLQGHGIRCWRDEKQFLPGDDVHEQIDRGIRLWDKVLLCCSKDSLTSWWVNGEIKRALAKEEALMKERGKNVLSLIPLSLDGYLFNGWNSGMATEIRTRFASDFTGWEHSHQKFEEQVERVILALRADDGGREKPPTPKL
jgi:hypothetical protein